MDAAERKARQDELKKAAAEKALEWLTPGQVVGVGSEPVQRCVRITRDGDTFSEKVLFDTLITPLQDGDNAGWYKATGKFTF